MSAANVREKQNDIFERCNFQFLEMSPNSPPTHSTNRIFEKSFIKRSSRHVSSSDEQQSADSALTYSAES
jgi:hypothetical protein